MACGKKRNLLGKLCTAGAIRFLKVVNAAWEWATVRNAMSAIRMSAGTTRLVARDRGLTRLVSHRMDTS
jgi:hypothetical protein